MLDHIIQSISEYPGFTPQINSFQLQQSRERELRELTETQYIDLENLGINHLEDETVSDSFFENILNFTHENYLPINQFDTIMQGGREIQLFGRFTYLYLCVDMINVILPKVLIHLGTTHSDTLVTFDQHTIRETIVSICLDRMNAIKQLTNITSNQSITYEKIKYAYYAELSDTYFSDFYTNYLEEVCYTYAHTINPTNRR